MPSWIANVLAFLRPFDPRPEGEIVADIESELHSHLEMRTQDNTALGMLQPEARRAAEQRFGDLRSATRDCQRIRLGDRTMLQRANAVVLGMLCALTVSIGWAVFQWKGETTERISGMASQLEQISDKLDESTIGNSPIPAHNPRNPSSRQRYWGKRRRTLFRTPHRDGERFS